MAYAREVVVNQYAIWRRRDWHGEVPHAMTADGSGSGPDPADQVVAREQVIVAFATLARHQRAVLVLRFFEDMSVEEAADVSMPVSAGVRRMVHRRSKIGRGKP